MAIQRDFKGNSLLIATDDYVVVDLETTGISPARDRIIEIGAVRVEHGTVTAEYSKLVNPGRPVGGFITGLTGISDEMVGNASPIEAVLPDFLAHLRPSDTIVRITRTSISTSCTTTACARSASRFHTISSIRCG
ncbi:exonuclease domain-containing protein [Bifidobacterium angulatum]